MGNDLITLRAMMVYPKVYDPKDSVSDPSPDINPSHYPNSGVYEFADDGFPPCVEISDKSQKEHMKYSDAITRRYAMNPIFLNYVKKYFPGGGVNEEARKLILENDCSQSMGNLAFIAYHNKDKPFWQKAYKDYVGVFCQKP